MANIPFSFDANGWESVDDGDNFDTWLKSEIRKSTETIHKGDGVSAFSSVVFQSDHIIDILKKTQSKLGLYSIVTKNTSGTPHSLLIAVRLKADERIDFDEPKAYIGPPSTILSNGVKIDSNKIAFISKVNGLNWDPNGIDSVDVGTWLLESRKQDSLQRSVDMMTKVVLNGEEIQLLLTEKGMVAFSLVIFTCNFDPKHFDLPGDCCFTFNRFSTIMVNKIVPISNGASKFMFFEDKFLVCANVWRPNYPPTGKSTILQRIRALETSLTNLKNKFLGYL